MLVVKHNPRHLFTMVAAFEDAEWSIWPDAAVTAMAGARRFPEEFPGPTGGGRHPRNQYRVAGYGCNTPTGELAHCYTVLSASSVVAFCLDRSSNR